MRLVTFLNDGGNCAWAFRFHEQHLRMKITAMMTRGQMPGGGETFMPMERDRFGTSLMILAERAIP
jgi:hypothetical protein